MAILNYSQLSQIAANTFKQLFVIFNHQQRLHANLKKA